MPELAHQVESVNRKTMKNINDKKLMILKKPEKINLEPSSQIDFEILECESNPELNPYIKKPKFSRDTANYDVSRKI